MKYKGIIKQSRTLDLAAITGAVGAAITALPQLQGLIDPQFYGLAFLFLSVAHGYLRHTTIAPVGQKGGEQ